MSGGVVGEKAQEDAASAALSSSKSEPEGVGTQHLRHLLTQGRPEPAAVAALLAQRPGEKSAMLSLLHTTLGNAYVQQVVSANPPAEASLDHELGEVKVGLELDSMVRSTLLPAYRRAVDAVDPAAALEIATHIVSAVRAAQRGKSDADEKVKAGMGAAMVSGPNSPIDDSAGAAAGRWMELEILGSTLSVDLRVLVEELAIQLGPQLFMSQPVAGSPTSPPLGKDPAQFLIAEAATVVNLLAIVQRTRSIAGATGKACAPLDDAQRRQIAELIEPWRSRPVNFAFLVSAMGEGIWSEVSAAKGPSGRSLQTTLQVTQAQAKATGALADVGEFDALDAEALLPGTEFQQWGADYKGIGDAPAAVVLDKIWSAAPNARGPIVRQLAAMNRLDFLCRHVPWARVKHLATTIEQHDVKAADLLHPYFDDRGNNKSMEELYMGEVDNQLAKGNPLDAFRMFVIERAHNMITAGFMHENSAALEALERGDTTEDDYYNASGKAFGKAVLVGAVSALTGSIAGEFAGGVAGPLGEKAAAYIAGGVGGAVAGVAGHATGDVYDQLLNGKQGFDSAGDYAKTALMGGGTGLVLAGVSLETAQYMPEAAKHTGDMYARRYPSMIRVLEAARRAGVGASATVQTTVEQLQEWLTDAIEGGLGGPRKLSFAAIGGELSRLPADTRVSIGARALEDLNRPMMMAGGENKTSDQDLPIELEDLKVHSEQGSSSPVGIQQRSSAEKGPDSTPVTTNPTTTKSQEPSAQGKQLEPTSYTSVEITDVNGKPVGEFDRVIHDGVETDKFVEDKSARGLSHPRNRQTPDQWAEKQIFEKTSVRIKNLKDGASSRPNPDGRGSPAVPSIAELRTVKEFEFAIEATDETLKTAVESQVEKLRAQFPNYRFSTKFGK